MKNYDRACRCLGLALIALLFCTAPGFAGNLINLSTRMPVGDGDNVLIAGFVLKGDAPMKVVVRAVGPSLREFGIEAPLERPLLELHDATGAIVARNGGWATDENIQELAMRGLSPADPRDSAMLLTLDPGTYTAVVRTEAPTSGVALVEVYDLAESSARAVNLSARGQVLQGGGVMIGGFVVGGAESKEVLIRGVGPSLSAFGISNVLANPKLELRDANATLVRQNDNWEESEDADAIRSRGLAPQNPAEAALLVTLPPGAYTALLSGVDETVGVGLVEIFDATDAP